jgi:serine/threonine protein kinase/WD40 repeat protein
VADQHDDLPTIPPPDTQAVTTSTRPTGGETPTLIDRIYAAAEVQQPKAGDEIGPYRIIELIGDGGFGAVYLVEQFEPVRRRVALKLIKDGMDSVEVLTRFEAERQALAMIDHPNVAKVFDAGVSREGRPYFAMEYVPGRPINRYCADENVSLHARLEMYIDICNAVQHAHQKGIIHRDLKPGNILVTTIDGSPVPKVIDFGIAKATTQALTNQPMQTSAGRLMGTPEYMSPEQAAGAGTGAADVDTRTDIYSLGVILYELLSGRLPFESAALRSGGFAGVVKMLAEVQPPRPSQRFSRDGGATVSLSVTLIRGDLDWITMKAMEKDRAMRYESASALAMDVRRHLTHEPVLAGPPSAAYKFRKFAKRNRVVLLAASAVAIALLVSLVIAIVSLLSARDERDLARFHQFAAEAAAANALHQKSRADVSEQESTRQKNIAEQALAETKEQKEAVVAAKHDLERAQYYLLFAAANDALQRGDLRTARSNLLACDPQVRAWEWYLLASRLDESSQSLYRPSDFPGCVAFDRDGRSLYVGALSITRYETDQFAPTLTFGRIKPGAARDNFRSISISPDGAFIAAARNSGESIDLYRTDSGESARKLSVLKDTPVPKAYNTPSWSLGEVRFTPDSKYVITAGWVVRVFDVATGLAVYRFPHESFCRGSAVSPDGAILATAASDAKLRIWDLRNPSDTPLRTFDLMDSAWSADFSPDGQHIAIGYLSSPFVQVFDVANGSLLQTLGGRGTDTARARFSPDGSLLAAASARGMINVWSVASGVLIKSFAGQVAATDIAWSPDGRQLATAGTPPAVRIWDVEAGDAAAALPRSSSNRLAYAVSSADASMLMGLDVSGAPALWKFERDDTFRRIDPISDGERRWFVFVDPQGKYSLTTGPNGSMTLFDLAKGQRLREFPLHSPAWVGGCVSANGKWIAAVGSDGRAEILDASNGTRVATSTFEKSSIFPANFSKDGAWLAAAGPNAVWLTEVPDQFDGQTLKPFKLAAPDPGARPGCVVFSPDDSRVVAMWDDAAAACWDVRTHALIWSRAGDRFTDLYFSATFNRDGRRLLAVGSSGQNCVLRLIDAQTGRTVLEFPTDPKDPIMAAAFVTDAAPADGQGIGEESIVLTHASLLRERLSVSRGNAYVRRLAVFDKAAELFNERYRSLSDDRVRSGILTLFNDFQPIDKKQKVFDGIMADSSVSREMKNALIDWMLESPE